MLADQINNGGLTKTLWSDYQSRVHIPLSSENVEKTLPNKASLVDTLLCLFVQGGLFIIVLGLVQSHQFRKLEN